MTAPRLLVASNYEALHLAYASVCYDFCSVIQKVGGAEIMTPPLRKRSDFKRVVAAVGSRMRRNLGVDRDPPITETTCLSRNYDLFFYVCPVLPHLVEVEKILGWRKRCRTTAAFILESWSENLERDKSAFRILDQFDHVFLFNKSSVRNVQRYTRASCHFLATGANCLTAAPSTNKPQRVIDVYSIGRRSPGLHRQLLEMAEQQEIFYVYDSLEASSRVLNWHEHRLLIANNIMRARYFIVHNHKADSRVGEESKAIESAGEQALTHRLFEGIAGGAVILGSAPDCSEFYEYFDWRDAVIELPNDSEGVRTVLSELDEQPDRVANLRRMNVVQSLRRHDWSYRWQTVLETTNIDVPPGLEERQIRLREMANALEGGELA